jgi:hypothetical protein
MLVGREVGRKPSGRLYALRAALRGASRPAKEIKKWARLSRSPDLRSERPDQDARRRRQRATQRPALCLASKLSDRSRTSRSSSEPLNRATAASLRPRKVQLRAGHSALPSNRLTSRRLSLHVAFVPVSAVVGSDGVANGRIVIVVPFCPGTAHLAAV